MQESKQPSYSVTAKTPKSGIPFWSNSKWLEDNEIPWLVEKYVHRYGFQFENFGEMSVVNMPQLEGGHEAMILFHHPLALNNAASSIMIDHQPQHLLQQLWRSSVLLNNRNPELPPRFKVCFITNCVQNSIRQEASSWLQSLFGADNSQQEKPLARGVVSRDNSQFVTGQHWFNLIFEFSGLNQPVLDILNNHARGNNGEITIPPPVDNQREAFFEKLPIQSLYDQLNITILDSASNHNKTALWVAKQICQGFTKVNIRQVSVPLQENLYTCADYAARNGVHYCLFGHAPADREDIRNNYLIWRKQEADATVSLALLKGFNYRLTYLQPGNDFVFDMAREEMLSVIDQYSHHLQQQAQSNFSLNPIKARRLDKVAALTEIRDLIVRHQSLYGVIDDIKQRHPKMFESSAGKFGFMVELVEVLQKLQRLILTPAGVNDSSDEALEYVTMIDQRPHAETPQQSGNVIEL